MAVYKIPQDVEADDKFVGPLSFKQFIYAGIAAISCYLSFISITKGFWPAIIIFLPIIIVFGFLGFPWGRDQPTEIWLAARIRFFLKPRVRIWNQAGIKELVTINVPKRIERHLTNGLSQDEVGSRLSGLADLLDSRGWAVKNVNVNMYSNPVAASITNSDDRLLDVTTLPQEVVDVAPADDVLDEVNSPTAQHFDEMIHDSEQKHREEVMSQLQAVRDVPQAQPAQAAVPTAPPKEQGSADFWFLQQGAHEGQHQTGARILEDVSAGQTAVQEPGFTTFQAPDLVAPHTASEAPLAAAEATFASSAVSQQDEQALLQKIHKDHTASYNAFGHIKTIQPLGQEPPVQSVPAVDPQTPIVAPVAPQIPVPVVTTAPVTAPVNPAIINLATNDDLNVSTLARQADKANGNRASDGEVVISLR